MFDVTFLLYYLSPNFARPPELPEYLDNIFWPQLPFHAIIGVHHNIEFVYIIIYQLTHVEYYMMIATMEQNLHDRGTYYN